MKALAILVTAAVAACFLGPAAAQAVLTPAFHVSGHGLRLAHGSRVAFSEQLTGADVVVAISVPMTVTDARGKGAGWHLNVTSKWFAAGGRNLPANASAVSSVAIACDSASTCTAPSNLVSYPLAVPAAATMPPAARLASAAAGTGLGAFSLTPTVEVTIPGDTYAGSYVSTFRFALVAGP